MNVYFIKHIQKPVTFIKLDRIELNPRSADFSFNHYMSLSNTLHPRRYQNGKYPRLYEYLKENGLLRTQIPGKGEWRKHWKSYLILRGVDMKELREQTEDIVQQALKGDRVLLNVTLPWNRASYLRSEDGSWLGRIDPENSLRRALRRHGLLPQEIRPTKATIKTAALDEFDPSSITSYPLPKRISKTTSPFERVFGMVR